ncbi:MAG: putative hydrolase of the superfamily [Actinomycetota bacterium]|nr:putative hydrolase of the superfamily [Actinomycetota bacterium]
MDDAGTGTGTGTGRTLVWDLGGVVLHWEPIQLVREAIGRSLTDLALFGDFAPGGFWSEFDRGVIGVDEVAVHMAAGAGIPVEEARQVLDAVPTHLSLREDTVSLIKRTGAAGHRSVYLSNMPGAYSDHLDTVLAPVFDEGVFSCRLHLVKPDPEIFAVAVRLLDLDPARLLFLDDREDNVEAARAAGWPAMLFRDAASCADDLSAAGWL